MNILRLLEPIDGSSFFLYGPKSMPSRKIGILRKIVIRHNYGGFHIV